MTLTAGDHEFGPGCGSLRLHTTREGVAAKIGHDLVLEFARWSGRLTVPAGSTDGAGSALEVRVEMDSLGVIEGTGGAAPLSDGDRGDIVRNAAKTLDVLSHPQANFRSTAVRPGPGGGQVEGTLNLAGASGTVVLDITAHEGAGQGSWRASATITQSDYGIKPYRAFLGALRLADSVRVEAVVRPNND